MNFSSSALFHTKTTVCLKYFVNDCRSAILLKRTHHWRYFPWKFLKNFRAAFALPNPSVYFQAVTPTQHIAFHKHSCIQLFFTALSKRPYFLNHYNCFSPSYYFIKKELNYIHLCLQFSEILKLQVAAFNNQVETRPYLLWFLYPNYDKCSTNRETNLQLYSAVVSNCWNWLWMNSNHGEKSQNIKIHLKFQNTLISTIKLSPSFS